MPSLSVALCTFQGARYLEAQLASISTQLRAPDELIVCDDGSTDRTLELARDFANAVAFPVRIYVNDATLGSTRNFDRAIGLCSGDLIALCDQDDVWRPDKLERLLAALHDDPAAGYVFSNARLVDDELRPLGAELWETTGFDARAKAEFRGQGQLVALLNRTLVTGATMLFRARYRPLLSPIPAAAMHDAWIATLLSAVGAHGVFVDDCLIDYRQHAEQQIGARTSRSWWPRRSLIEDRRALAARRLAYSKGLLARLAEVDTGTLLSEDTADVERWLADVVSHLEQRARAHELRSLGRVIREWRSGRYRSYSGGAGAVALDLLNCLVYRCE